MELKNCTEKAVSKKLPSKEIVTLEPGESFDFPNHVGYYGDERLSKLKAPVKENPKLASRIKEVVGDLLDDGKRNYSNNSKKKSPGRKSKKK